MAKATTGARQREAQGWILGLIDKGFGNTQIIEFLRSFDMGYRDSVIRSDINRLRVGVLSRDVVKTLGPGETVDPALMGPIHGNHIADYRAIVTADFANPDTKELETRTVTLHFRQPPSQNDVLNEMDKRRELWQEKSGLDLSRVTGISFFRWEPDAT